METYAIKLANEFSANIIRILLSQEREKWIRHLALHRKLRRSSPGHHSRKRLKRARTQLRYIDR